MFGGRAIAGIFSSHEPMLPLCFKHSTKWIKGPSSEPKLPSILCHPRRLLCEVHEEYRTNIRLANQGYWV